MAAPHYSHNQLLVLHHLKRYGPILKPPRDTITRTMAAELGMKDATLKYVLRTLETQCIILRSYKNGKPSFGDKAGTNHPMTKLELVDPDMVLPAIPQVYVTTPPDQQRKPTPLGIVMAHENEELDERVESSNGKEPTVESVIDALIDRALELQKQVDKLQDVIEGLNAENARLVKAAKPQPTHLSSRVRDVLPPDVWERLKK
jgi:hypothetical protein